MKTLGIVGGIGPESTIEYYRRILARCRERGGGRPAPSILINSVDNRTVLDLAGAKRFDELTEFLTHEVTRLAAGGASLVLLAANTPHLVFNEVRAGSSVPLLSIVEVTCRAAKAAGARRPALFGTRFTMQASFYPEAFAREQMEIVLPNEAEQAFIHEKYMSELLGGIIKEETRDALKKIVQALKDRAAIDALILGGTELSLIFREPRVADLPVVDTTQIHVDAAVAWLLDEVPPNVQSL